MKSIIQTEKECYNCKCTTFLEEHHIFGGAKRKLSEKYGLKVYLCHAHHNEPPSGVHFNAENMQKLHEVGQKAYMKKYNKTKNDFIKEFGKNYLF